MNKLKNKFLFISTVITLLTSANTTGAVEIFLRDPDHRGVIEFTPFQIYPENRVGNGIYLEKKLLDSHPQRVILNIVNIKDTDNHVYLYRGLNGVLGLDIVKNDTGEDVRFWKVDPEFYQYSNRTSGTRRVFRIFEDKIIPLLPNLRTGTGVAASQTHAVFYHITESSNSSDNLTNSNPGWNYKFRLHLTRLGQSQLVSLYQINIVDQSLKLKLSWKNEFELIHRKKDGSEEIYNLQKISPQMF